tara:strand:+ start:313 stop:444 length:132 start_codon:yes stop_codon:yes gene_type:complete
MEKIDKTQIEILKTGKDTDESSLHYCVSIIIDKINEIIDEVNK